MDAVAWWAARAPDAPALKDPSTRWTYAELHAAVGRMARRMEPLGVAPGRVVALVAHPDVPAVVALHAVRRSGAVLVPLNPQLTAPELERALEGVGADVVLTTAGTAPDLAVDPAWTHVVDDLPPAPGGGAEGGQAHERGADAAAAGDAEGRGQGMEAGAEAAPAGDAPLDAVAAVDAATA
ncbi:MAG: hypothetical protein D6701_04010, partial [Gemmatimonadetes bacterium]